MYFGGVNGFNFFHPDSIKFNQITPEVVFTEFRIQNGIVNIEPKGILKQSISETDEIVLNHKENMISISFVGIQYSSSEKNIFQYTLEGFHKKWINIGSQRSVTFTNLNPGDYTLKVKAANSDGIWNEGVTTLSLKVLPAWYETLFFRIFFILFIFGSITAIYLFRLNLIARQKKALEEEVFLRTIEIQEKSNEINTQNEELKAQQEELETHQDLMMKNNEKLVDTIEKLKNAQAKLIQSEKMASLGTLTAGIAHELNNPLNYVSSGIIGLKKALGKFLIILKEYEKIDEANFHKKAKKISLLKEDISYSPMIELISKVTKGIEIGAKRSTEIVKGLRTFSRMENEISQNIDIHSGIESTILLLHHTCKDRVTIHKKFGDIPGISCFPGKLNQVFMNVLSNAIDAIEGEGKIEISTRFLEKENKKYVQIGISDTGKGIGSHLEHKIFEPFFTTKDVGKGTGLGLAISRTIVEEHQGKIKIESKVGKGTTVCIIIPIRPE